MKSRSLFVSFFLVAAVIMGTHCGGGEKNGGMTPTPQPTPSPSPDPLELAKMTFATKVFPFYNHDRCVNCHDFVTRAPTFIAGGTHTVNPGDACVGCHTHGAGGVLGWDNNPPASPPWGVPPPSNNWVKNDDPQRLRTLSIDQKGPLLYKHLVGTGADADEFVQWCFKKPPSAGAPPDAPPIKPGGVPPGGVHAGGPIPDDELLDWPSFKTAVDEWICRESMVPGAPDLGKPAALDCSVF